jgi:hypothetical protein
MRCVRAYNWREERGGEPEAELANTQKKAAEHAVKTWVSPSRAADMLEECEQCVCVCVCVCAGMSRKKRRGVQDREMDELEAEREVIDER